MQAFDRKERDKQLRRTDIFNAAERLFAAKGFNNTSIEEIAREAQYAVGTIYLYFKGKEQLYFELLYEKMKYGASKVRKELAEIDDPLEKIRKLIQTKLIYFKENESFFRIFMTEQFNLKGMAMDDTLRNEIMRTFRSHIDFISKIIREIMLECNLKTYDPVHIAYVLLGMIRLTAYHWVMEKKHGSIEQAADTIFNLFFHGLMGQHTDENQTHQVAKRGKRK